LSGIIPTEYPEKGMELLIFYGFFPFSDKNYLITTVLQNFSNNPAEIS
jgi:hypothetical protein